MKRHIILIFTLLAFFTTTTSTSAAVTIDGLVAYYPFNGNADDESGNGHDGTVYGATLTTDRFGNTGGAYSFDGIDDYISVDYTSSFQLPVFTVSAWILPTIDLSAARTPIAIVSRGEDLTTDHTAFVLTIHHPASHWANGVAVIYEEDGNEQIFDTNVYPEMKKWTHLVASRDTSGLLSIYSDGSLIGQWSSTADPDAACFQDLLIGAYWYVPTPVTAVITNFFTGAIDDVMIFNRALTPDEIRDISVIPAPSAPVVTWTDPTPLAEINSDYHDKEPFLSFDGLTLYFVRMDTPGWYYARIYQATRSEPHGQFTSVEEISTLNDSSGHVSAPWVSPDNLRMYYYRTESPGISRIKLSERTSTNELWLPGINVSELNILGSVSNPSLTEDELTIIFHGYNLSGGQGGYDIWMATRPDKNSSFKNIMNLSEINSSVMDAHPSVSADGLTLYFDSDRNGNSQLFRTTRESLDSPFSIPEHLSLFDSPESSVWCPSLNSDEAALYFARWPENDMADIYISYISDTIESKTYYIDTVNGNDLNNGLSPNTAFGSTQTGIDTAGDGDIVLVYPGLYQEEINFLGKALTVQGISTGPAGIPVLHNPGDFAVSFYSGEGPDSILTNFIIKNSFITVFIADSSPTISNLTIVDNEYGIKAYAGSQPDISNSIFWNNTNADLLGCQARYSCTKNVGIDEGNIDTDPLFVDPNNGDYHLLSKRGRYWPEHDIWVLDNVTSPCIDGGDPAADPSNEPMPNGARVNMGAYGRTRYASMSESLWFDADINSDRVVDLSDMMELIEK